MLFACSFEFLLAVFNSCDNVGPHHRSVHDRLKWPITGPMQDFRANGRKAVDDGLGETSIFLGHVQNLRRSGAKSSRTMLSSLLGNAVIPDQAFPVPGVNTVRTGQGAIPQ